jgi:hypothetical protein
MTPLEVNGGGFFWRISIRKMTGSEKRYEILDKEILMTT